MPIFKVEVTKEKTWVEYCQGTAYIKASSLEQAEKKARRINRAIRNAEYDLSEFSDVKFDEGSFVLVNTNDFAEGNEEFVATAKKLHDWGEGPENIEFELGKVEEVENSIDKSTISTLDVPERSES